ncbi:hypothetical protein [Aureispira sp. CCB-QB1]|uniref:hypothetical protein n=1 Tax=Aureispira sp. CCB-QB1 TaxID=1313421 RepID=UPI000699001B|nr:hypothetical protein [Aureispira sp. CCB-QB1]
MEKLQTGTLAELRGDSTTNPNPTASQPTIKVASPAPTATNELNTSSNASATVIKEPTTNLSTTNTPTQAGTTPCGLCKAKSIANLAFSFSLVILVLAFSFSLVKSPK